MSGAAGTPANGPASVGQRFGDYLVTGLLGEGGVGFVYRAEDESGRAVALKVVKPELADDTTFRRRFNREARIAQGIEHDHVVPVLATGEQDGVLATQDPGAEDAHGGDDSAGAPEGRPAGRAGGRPTS